MPELTLQSVDPSSLDDFSSLAQDLLSKYRSLYNEIDAFLAFLKQRTLDNVPVRSFKRIVETEMKSLENASTNDEPHEQSMHTLQSSNLPFLTAVWETTKRCRGLDSLLKRFQWDAHVTDVVPPSLGNSNKHLTKFAIVDVVAEDGLQWVKISTMSEKRLLIDMAAAGWNWDNSSDNDSNSGDDDSAEDEVELIKLASNLKNAAAATRVRYRHPTVEIVLQRITQGSVSDIDKVISKIRAMGITVTCAGSNLTPLVPRQTSLQDVFERMLSHPFDAFTETVNVDCTLLLAFVSDLSHSSVTPSPTHHKAILHQIKSEADMPLLPSSLWPAVADKHMVTVTEAYNRFKTIVNTIGTPSERERALILMKEDAYADKSCSELQAEFQKWTRYAVPTSFCLPIHVCATTETEKTSSRRLPSVAAKVANQLTPINRAIFLYGWRAGLTTISSNRTVAKQIENVIEENRTATDDDLRGPDIWLCGTARSLLAKDKGRRD